MRNRNGKWFEPKFTGHTCCPTEYQNKPAIENKPTKKISKNKDEKKASGWEVSKQVLIEI